MMLGGRKSGHVSASVQYQKYHSSQQGYLSTRSGQDLMTSRSLSRYTGLCLCLLQQRITSCVALNEEKNKS